MAGFCPAGAFLRCLPVLCFLLAGASRLSAAEGSLELAWYPNDDETTAGYKVHYGTQSGRYDRSLDVGRESQAWVPDLEAGTRYYFSVTAYGEDGSMSPFSDELAVTATIKPPPAGARPAEVKRFSRLAGDLLEFRIERGARVGEVLLYSSDDLKNWKLACRLPSLSTGILFRDPEAAGAPRRFYRAVTRFLADR